jgi:hypothetical protein
VAARLSAELRPPPDGGPVRLSTGISEHVSGRPAAALAPYIAAYSAYRDAGVAPAVHRGLPSPFLTLIFTLDDPLEIAGHPDPGQAPGRYDTLVGGLHTSPALVRHDGRQSGIQVALSPLGARALLGRPAGELASLDVEGDAVLGRLAERAGERLRACSTWPQRFAVLDEVLATRAASVRRPAVSPEVAYAWRTLLRSGGRARVADLATGSGWSGRHLRTQFGIEIGLTPKAAARVIRRPRGWRRSSDTSKRSRT